VDQAAIVAGWVAAAAAPDGPVDAARSLAHIIARSGPVKTLAIGRLAVDLLFDDLRC
jgi:hypothetical protein